jgi:phage shock protein PspC (stress-responsive transcriptional regulator)
MWRHLACASFPLLLHWLPKINGHYFPNSPRILRYILILCIFAKVSDVFPSFHFPQIKFCMHISYIRTFFIILLNLAIIIIIPPYCGVKICAPQWPRELCRREHKLLVEPPMPYRSKGRGQTKCSPWSSRLRVLRVATDPKNPPIEEAKTTE